MNSETLEQYKRAAADRAAQMVESGMVVGLGSGTTAVLALRRLAERLAEGSVRAVAGVPTSAPTAELARELGVPLTTLDDRPELDLTFDGADEVAPDSSLIKGGGGAFLREKIVAQASRREVIAVDSSKLSAALGSRRRVPVAVFAFGWRAQVRFLESLGAKVALRRATREEPVRTEDGHLVLDCDFGPIAAPASLARALDERTGIAAHGLFLGLATDLVIAGPSGVEHRRVR